VREGGSAREERRAEDLQGGWRGDGGDEGIRGGEDAAAAEGRDAVGGSSGGEAWRHRDDTAGEGGMKRREAGWAEEGQGRPAKAGRWADTGGGHRVGPPEEAGGGMGGGRGRADWRDAGGRGVGGGIGERFGGRGGWHTGGRGGFAPEAHFIRGAPGRPTSPAAPPAPPPPAPPIVGFGGQVAARTLNSVAAVLSAVPVPRSLVGADAAALMEQVRSPLRCAGVPCNVLSPVDS
jgi:hypothetical protein